MFYADNLTNITQGKLQGFFVGWPYPPSPQTHLRILQQSYRIVLAIDDKSGSVVGYLNAISDGILSAYIPLLEVLPAYQGQGIGRELVRRMLEQLDDLYMVDLTCDPDLQEFYAALGMRRATGMLRRNYEHQAGKDKLRKF
ncbi:MAG TPA: GNAT family N-acetyltransferase [Thermoflexia bacterium]|nr:GNAT family N-acetyltransferase [Thermoflexia bacterium]